MLLAPAMARRELGAHEELSNVLDGWDAFPAVVEPDVAALIQTLHDEPEPLCAALARYPHTLIHGDYKLANLGIQRRDRPRAILLDWTSVGIAPPAVDLAWYLGLAAIRLPISKE